MTDYATKTYGRNDEVASLYKMFVAGRDISMHGPRRLGKTFLLDRLVDAAPARQWTAVKVELAGCTDSRAVFRELCSRIGNRRSGGENAKDWDAIIEMIRTGALEQTRVQTAPPVPVYTFPTDCQGFQHHKL